MVIKVVGTNEREAPAGPLKFCCAKGGYRTQVRSFTARCVVLMPDGAACSYFLMNKTWLTTKPAASI